MDVLLIILSCFFLFLILLKYLKRTIFLYKLSKYLYISIIFNDDSYFILNIKLFSVIDKIKYIFCAFKTISQLV